MPAPLAIHVAFPMLFPAIDLDRIRAIAGADTTVDCVAFEISHEQRTRREQHPHDPATRAADPPLDDAQRAAFAAADVLFTLDSPVRLGAVAPHLRWVQAIGSGVGQFVAADLPDAGIVLTNGAGIGAPPIAEWVVARVLQILKLLPEHDANAREHRWHTVLGSNLAGRTAVVVGLGAIGRATARLLRPFDVRVIGIRRTVVAGFVDPDVDELLTPDALHEALGRADIVVLAAPGTDTNENLFDEATFAAMRPGSIFVNVARGTLVDEGALIQALRTGHLRSAAIDVARHEPMPFDDPLWDVSNLLISPHSSTSGDGYADRAFDLFCRNLAHFVRGEPLDNVVKLDTGY
jgi:phosphoglycerate dehydrogenase-like enzyme